MKNALACELLSYVLLLYTADNYSRVISPITSSSSSLKQVQKAVQNNSPVDCSQCAKDCSYKDSFKYCKTHKIQKEDAYSGQHFCLEHEHYHCIKHWRICCSKLGYSVMTARPVTTAHLHKRAQEIITEQKEEIKKMESYIEQIKQGRFICAECRGVCCICDMTKWKRYEKKRRSDIKSMNNI